MAEEIHISKFFKALVAAGGQMSRSDLAIKVLSRNWSAKALDELLTVPVLARLVTTSRERIRGTGRRALRYILTPEGWVLARAWLLLPPAADLPLEELRRQFDLLVAAGNPWAVALVKDAQERRAWRAEQERIREQKRIEAEERRKEREADRPKYPSAGRHRSERDLAERRRFVESKRLERAAAPASIQRAQPPQSRPMPSGPTQPSPGSPASPVNDWEPPQLPDWYADLYKPTPATAPSPAPMLDRKTADLIGRIKTAGYRTNDCGEVLYDQRWIPVSEWLRRMPDALQ